MQKRKHMYLILAVFFLVGPFFLTSCASSLSSQAYSRDQARQSMRVSYGTVRDVRPVRIEGTKSGAGAVAGGAVGGVLGSMVGRGKGSVLGAVVGALGGAAGGALAEEGMTRQNGLEITVEMDTGETLAITQAADLQFHRGERVRVLHSPDGTARVQK